MTDLRRENGWRDDLWDGGIKRGRELQAKEDKAEIDALRRSLGVAIDALEAIRAACEKCRDPLYGFSPLELEILAILGIELGSKKAVFEWCPKCKFYKNCYGDPDAINPKYLEPRCGEGPVLEEIGG